MKKLVFACCSAAVSVACHEPERSPQVPQAPPSRTVSSLTPKATDLLPSPQADAGPVGVEVTARIADPLGLSHQSPTVDHLARAQQLKSEGDSSGALTEARRALFTAPNDEEALVLAGQLARRLGQHPLAAAAWARLAELRPDDAAPLVQQARALRASKDFEGAVRVGREAITRDPENAEAHQTVGLGLLSLNQLSAAIASFQRAVEIEPTHGWAQNNLGFACLLANHDERAVETLEKAAELLPTAAAVQNNLGVALERVGRMDEAKAAYQQAMDLSPKYVKARINSARVAKAILTPEDLSDSVSDQPHPLPETSPDQ